MKKLIFVCIMLGMISACSEKTEQEKQRTHERAMLNMQLNHERKMNNLRESYPQSSYQNPNAGYDQQPVAPGTYTNYMGDPNYGSWNQQGQWGWNNPNSPQASSTSNYLIGAGLGAAAMYAISKSDYTDHWRDKPKTKTVNTYIDKSGKQISKSEYTKRNTKYQTEKKKRITSNLKVSAKKKTTASDIKAMASKKAPVKGQSAYKKKVPVTNSKAYPKSTKNSYVVKKSAYSKSSRPTSGYKKATPVRKKTTYKKKSYKSSYKKR